MIKTNKKRKWSLRWLGTLALIAGISFCVGFLWSFSAPPIKSWIFLRVHNLSERYLPVKIRPHDIDVRFFPFRTSLKNIRFEPQPEVAQYFDTFDVHNISADLALWPLLQGRLIIQNLKIEGADIHARIPLSSKSDSPSLKWNTLFEYLSRTPIHRVELSGIKTQTQLQLDQSDLDKSKDKTKEIIIIADNLNLAAEYSTDLLTLESTVGEAFLYNKDDRDHAIPWHWSMKAQATPESLKWDDLSFDLAESNLRSSGESQIDADQSLWRQSQVDAMLQLNLTSLESSLKSLHLDQFTSTPHKNLQLLTQKDFHAQGQLKLESRLIFKHQKDPWVPQDIDFRAEGEKIHIEDFDIGTINTRGHYQTQRGPRGAAHPILHLQPLQVLNKGTKVQSGQTLIEFLPDLTPVQMSTSVQIQRLALNNFLNSLGLKKIPVDAQIEGGFQDCKATFQPSYQMQCEGRLQVKKFSVWDDEVSPIKNIVAVDDFSAQGNIRVDTKGVHYNANAQMPRSKGKSQGSIYYDEGFHITYSGDKLNFADVTNLTDLKIEGQTQVEGRTDGNAHSATFSALLNGENIWFEDYGLNNIKTELSYKSGMLSFKKINGNHKKSRYFGDINVDLHRKYIEGKAQIPFYTAEEVLESLKRKAQLPWAASGTGQAQVQFSGPLAFTALSYTLKSSLFRGTFHNEKFEEAHFDIHAKNGVVSTDRVQVRQDGSTLSMTGKGYPNGDIKCEVIGKKLRLENLGMIHWTGLTLGGETNFKMNLSGYVLLPETQVEGDILSATAGDFPIPNTHYQIKLHQKSIEGTTTFSDNSLESKFQWPYDNTTPFKINLKAQNLNFAPLLASMTGSGGFRRDYKSHLTGYLNLSSPSGGFWTSNGQLEVTALSLERPPSEVHIPAPVSIQMKNGMIKVNKFELVGQDSFFRIKNSAPQQHPLDISMDARIDLYLASLFLPFFEEIRGNSSLTWQLKAGPQTWDLLGSFNINRAYLKIANFPHPLENIQADAIFNQKKMLINKFSSLIAGGDLTADGSMFFRGHHNIPTNIQVQVKGAKINLPENVLTEGLTQLHITGEWFPFTVNGTYEIDKGMVTRELDASPGGDLSGVQRSAFLPKLILEQGFNPLDLNLNIKIKKPLRVKNSHLDGQATGDLQLKGPPHHLLILGQINAVKDSKLTFRDNTFEILSGVATFSDPTRINPNLYLTARSRINEQYDVNMIIQGTAQKPELHLSSTPPLSEPDIMSLLAFGMPGQQVDEVKVQDQARSTGASVGGLLLKNPATETLKEKTGIEVGITTGYDATNSMAVPKITANRSISQRLGLSASRSLGNDPKTEAKLRYQLSNRTSVVGRWEATDRQETTETNSSQLNQQDKFGVDFEYRFEFK